MALMDTSAIIDLGRGNKRVLEAAAKAEREGERLLACTISVFELSAGSPPGIEEKRRRLLEPMGIVRLTQEHAEAAGKIYKNLRESGSGIGAFDALIAATAICENEPLITANKKHFGRVDGLALVFY